MASFLQNRQVNRRELEIDGVPANEFKPRKNEVKGGVIFYHGWSSNKENQTFRASTIASFGFRVLVPDAINHGSRGEIDYDTEESLRQNFFPTVIQSVLEANSLLNYLREKINGGFLAVAGHSMGGFTAGGVFVHYPKIATQINVNGSCAWLETRNLLVDKPGSFADKVNIQGIDYELKKFDPYYNLDNLDERPLLLLHGEQDTSVPLAGQKIFYQAALSRYQNHPGRLNLITYDNLNHYYTTGMLAETIEWLFKVYQNRK